MLRFLVVDNDHPTVTGMTKLLISDGHTVLPFTSGADAVDALARESFDAVITDLEMPGVNGYAVARAARERQPDACVVVVSARATEAAEALAEAGACIIASKPLDFDRLTATVHECRSHVDQGSGGRCRHRVRAGAPVHLKMRRD